MKKIIISIISVSLLFILTACGVSQSSLEDTYDKMKEDGEVCYYHFAKKGKLEMAIPLGEKSSYYYADEVGTYKVVESGVNGKIKLQILNKKNTVNISKTKDGLLVGQAKMTKISAEKAKKYFDNKQYGIPQKPNSINFGF